MKQAGQISPTLLIGGFLLLALALAGAVIYAKVQTARLDASQQANKSLTQQVSQWTNAATACSKATEDAAKDADTRTRNATIALKQAKTGERQAKDEIARLKAQKPTSGAVCPAGEAVAEIRKGLK